MQPSYPHAHIRFGVFELDLRAGELRKSGSRIRLQEQPLRVLQALLERPGAVVTREELRQRLWPEGTRVDVERSLTKALVRLRDALGDDADSPRFVETLPRHGYRFIASVVPDGAPAGQSANVPSEAMPRRPVRWQLTVGVAAAVLVSLAIALGSHRSRAALAPGLGIQSLAVLPLRNLSGDPGQNYFAQGLTDELTTNLARIHSLRVVSATSTLQFAEGHEPLGTIASTLRVDAIVEGSVTRSGDRVRVTAQLIDARSDAHLWAESYERELGAVLDVQDTIALEIASQVNAKLTGGERAVLSAHHGISADALEAYLRGRNELTKQSKEAIQAGIRYFQRTVDLEPLFAPGYAGLAASYNLTANYAVLPPRVAFPRAKVAARRALEIDSSLGAAHAALAMARHHNDWDWPGAEAEYRQAIALSPGDPGIRLRFGEFLSNSGRHDEALSQLAVARELDPLSMLIATNTGRFLYHARRYDAAIRELQQSVTVSPSRLFTWVFLGMTYDEKGMHTEALQSFERAAQVSHGALGVGAAHAYATAGRTEEARRLLGNLEADSRDDDVRDWFFFAGVHAALGEKDVAFAWLEQALENDDYFLTFAGESPWMDPLRSDPRFGELLRRIGVSR